MKINIGSAYKRYKGYSNVDRRPDQDVDIVADLSERPWPWENNSIDQILAEEFFEHISWKLFTALVREAYRVLKPAGFLQLTVPDVGKLCEYYVRGQICDCVPHKEPKNGFNPDPKCNKCKGKAKIHPERFRQALSGAQKHPFDSHLNQFFKKDMIKDFEKVGFKVIDISPDNWYKIKLKVVK